MLKNQKSTTDCFKKYYLRFSENLALRFFLCRECGILKVCLNFYECGQKINTCDPPHVFSGLRKHSAKIYNSEILFFEKRARLRLSHSILSLDKVYFSKCNCNKTFSVYRYCFCFVYLFYDQIRRYGLLQNAAFTMWPSNQINCPPLVLSLYVQSTARGPHAALSQVFCGLV